jgi:hypothetical protein
MFPKFEKGIYKSLAILMISLQCSATAVALASDSTSQTVTPEASLLTSAYAMRGNGLAAEEMKSVLQQSMVQYGVDSAGESDNDRESHLRDALVNLGIYSEQQTEVLLDRSKSVDSSGFSTPDTKDKMVQQIADIVSSLPQGAQFSACTSSNLHISEWILSMAGLVVGTVGLVTNACISTDHMVSYMGSEGCYVNSSGDYDADPTSKVHSTAGKVMIAAGFGTTAVIAILAIIQGESCSGN